MAASDVRDSTAPAKTGRTSLLDSGEDFEVLNEEDMDDDPPPLEDAGGGKGENTAQSDESNANTDPDPPAQIDEWLDVLGMLQKPPDNVERGAFLQEVSQKF